MIYIILIIVSLTCIALSIYIVINKKINGQITEKTKLKQKLDAEKSALYHENALLTKRNAEINQNIDNRTQQLAVLQKDIDSMNDKFSQLTELYIFRSKQQEEILSNELREKKEKQQEVIEKEIEKYKDDCQKKKDDITKAFEEERANFERILADYKEKRNSIIQISKEEEEIRQESKFYSLHISSSDLADIEILERIKPSLSKPDILSKLIYKTYYEKAYTDLVGRVLGTKKITGIYKITNLLDNKVYIGQAVDVAERWRQHIKRAVGAEPMTTNKLYPIMKEYGPYNFSWQLIEECSKEDLNEKEKYWIQFYDGQGYGYNIKG